MTPGYQERRHHPARCHRVGGLLRAARDTAGLRAELERWAQANPRSAPAAHEVARLHLDPDLPFERRDSADGDRASALACALRARDVLEGSGNGDAALRAALERTIGELRMTRGLEAGFLLDRSAPCSTDCRPEPPPPQVFAAREDSSSALLEQR